MLPLQTTGARHEKVKRTGASAQGVSSNYTQKKRVTFQGKAAAPLKKRRTTAQRARDDLLLHRRFLHASDRRLRATAMSEGVIGLEFTGAQDTADCSCQLSNAIKARFASEKRERATVPGGRVYTDLKTVKVRSTAGFRYMCCFVDDYSRHGKIYFLKKKSDFMRDALKPYLQYLSQHSITLKILHSDCGGEYVSDETVAFLKSRNISPEYSPPHCQSLNGVAEVFWREIMKMTRYAIHDQQRPLSMWPAGAKLSETIRNSLITKAVPDVPPLVAFLDKEIDVSHLRVPLCDAFPYIEKHNRAGDGGTDLDRRRATMIYVGNDDDSRSYRLWDPKTERVYSRRYADVLFDERPKAQQTTPTTQTAHPTDVQIFHEEAADELTAEPGSTTSSAAAENTSKSAEQQNDQGSFSHGNSAPFPSGKSPRGPSKRDQKEEKGKAHSAAKKKGTIPKAHLPAPAGFITLQQDCPASQVADMFDLDPAEYLQYLQETPGAKGTWMDKLKSTSSVIKAGSHVPSPLPDTAPMNANDVNSLHTTSEPSERALRAMELDCLKLLWLEELNPYLMARRSTEKAARGGSAPSRKPISKPFNLERAMLARAKDPAPKATRKHSLAVMHPFGPPL